MNVEKRLVSDYEIVAESWGIAILQNGKFAYLPHGTEGIGYVVPINRRQVRLVTIEMAAANRNGCSTMPESDALVDKIKQEIEQ